MSEPRCHCDVSLIWPIPHFIKGLKKLKNNTSKLLTCTCTIDIYIYIAVSYIHTHTHAPTHSCRGYQTGN